MDNFYGKSVKELTKGEEVYIEYSLSKELFLGRVEKIGTKKIQVNYKDIVKEFDKITGISIEKRSSYHTYTILPKEKNLDCIYKTQTTIKSLEKELTRLKILSDKLRKDNSIIVDIDEELKIKI